MSCASPTDTELPWGHPSRPIPLYRGKSLRFTVKLTNSVTERRVDLTGYTGRAALRRNIDDVGVALITPTVTITNATRGEAEVFIGATSTATGATPDIGPGMYVIDVEFEDTGTPDPDEVLPGGIHWVRVLGEAAW